MSLNSNYQTTTTVGAETEKNVPPAVIDCPADGLEGFKNFILNSRTQTD